MPDWNTVPINPYFWMTQNMLSYFWILGIKAAFSYFIVSAQCYNKHPYSPIFIYYYSFWLTRFSAVGIIQLNGMHIIKYILSDLCKKSWLCFEILRPSTFVQKIQLNFLLLLLLTSHNIQKLIQAVIKNNYNSVCVCSVIQSCPTLCGPMYCSPL